MRFADNGLLGDFLGFKVKKKATATRTGKKPRRVAAVTNALLLHAVDVGGDVAENLVDRSASFNHVIAALACVVVLEG